MCNPIKSGAKAWLAIGFMTHGLGSLSFSQCLIYASPVSLGTTPHISQLKYIVFNNLFIYCLKYFKLHCLVLMQDFICVNSFSTEGEGAKYARLLKTFS